MAFLPSGYVKVNICSFINHYLVSYKEVNKDRVNIQGLCTGRVFDNCLLSILVGEIKN